MKIENDSYADLVKNIKDAVHQRRTKFTSKKIMKTVKGDLLIKVVGRRYKTMTLKDAIKNKHKK